MVILTMKHRQNGSGARVAGLASPLTHDRDLNAHFDTTTIRHLTRLGVGTDGRAWRCLTIGSSPTVTRWLGGQVRPRGSVTEVVDDPSDRPAAAPFAFDLVHSVGMLASDGHIPAGVLHTLADAVAPGGLLLVEELDDGGGHLVGRRLPELVEATGLTRIGHEATTRVSSGVFGPLLVSVWAHRPPL
jgi:hypothetical protein